MKKRNVLALLLCLSGSVVQAQMKSQYTPYELDILEAHLNKQWKRVEEFNMTYAKFLAIRQDTVLNGYEKDVAGWYDDVGGWLQGWNNILSTMKSPALVDQQVQRDVTQAMKNQLTILDTILHRIPGIQKKGADAMKALTDLPLYPSDYIDVLETSSSDNYGPQIEQYKKQLDIAKVNLQTAQAAFAKAQIDKLNAIGYGLEGMLLLKIKTVLVNSPVLEEALKETQAALDQLRSVDLVLARLETERSQIASEISAQKIFYAKAHLASWKAKGEAAVQGIENNPRINATVQDHARQVWEIKVKGIEETLKTVLSGRSEIAVFAGFYNTELYGSFGMVRQCLETPRPLTIDCNLLRTVQGFKRSQLMRLKPEQAAYIESLILKAKQGVMRPKS
jgi:hypothetical protein